MLEWIGKALRRKREIRKRLLLTCEGFELSSGDAVEGSVWWENVDRIVVYKEDLLIYDAICMAFMNYRSDDAFIVHEEIDGFWDVVQRVKDIFPSSHQSWERVVVEPVFERNQTTIYERTPGADDPDANLE